MWKLYLGLLNLAVIILLSASGRRLGYSGLCPEATLSSRVSPASSSIPSNNALIEPAHIRLEPTSSLKSCDVAVYKTSPISGHLNYTGDCHGFIGTIILMNSAMWHRQAVRISPSRQLTWDVPMPYIDVAMITLYQSILPHEVLADSFWLNDDRVTYAPNITVFNVSVLEADSAQHHPLGYVPANASTGYGRTKMWVNQKLLSPITIERATACYASAAAHYDKILIVGTSESRNMFKEVCEILATTLNVTVPSDIGPKTQYSECHKVQFVNTCQWGCACQFLPALADFQPDLSRRWISVSCGLHGEYLRDAGYFNASLQDLHQWADDLYGNGTRIQYRVANAVNPVNTSPQKFTVARNNFKSGMLRDLAVTSQFPKVAILDVFELTEGIFDLSTDHVHYWPWVYRELALHFMESLCYEPS